MKEEEWCRVSAPRAESLQEGLPVEEELQDLGEFFRVFGDPTRIRILALLSQEALCVHDLTRLLGMQQTAVSHQLKILRHNRLVRYHKEGRMAIYTLDDEHIERLMAVGLEHIRERSS